MLVKMKLNIKKVLVIIFVILLIILLSYCFVANYCKKIGDKYMLDEKTNVFGDNKVSNEQLQNEFSGKQGELTYTTTIGKIKLSCIDENSNPVAGCTFELLDTNGKSYGEVETGDDGIITFYKVPEGEYLLKQVKIATGYESQEDVAKNVIVTGGKMSEVVFNNITLQD